MNTEPNPPLAISCMDAIHDLFNKAEGGDVQRLMRGYEALEHEYGRSTALEALITEHAIAVIRLYGAPPS